MSNVKYIASPSIIALAGRLGIDLADVARTTGRTHIAREDVERHGNGNYSASVVSNVADNDTRFWNVDHSLFGTVSQEAMPKFARAAAENLSAANRVIPQVTHHDRADMRAITALRTRLKTKASARNIRLTALAFQVKALTKCLAQYPRFNASLTADGKTLVLKRSCHIGIAVDTPQGLVVPVIRHADKKGLWQIASEITDLATRAQMRKIKQNELGGASMSISNLGGIGGTAFTPIVNPPELAILGITRTEKVPVWEDDQWKPVPMAPLDLSYDHRVINGAEAARFMTSFCQLLSDPRCMML